MRSEKVLTTAELVARLTGLGVELRPEGERLRFRAPRGVLSPEMRNELVRRKQEILAWMRRQGEAAPRAAYEKLFEPLSIGPLELKNRLVMSPMEVDFGAADGSVTPRAVDYYAARARGGVGLVVVEATCVDTPAGRISPYQLVIDRDGVLPGFECLVEAVLGHGARVLLQLQHAGRKTSSTLTGQVPVAPSAVASHQGETPRALTEAEIAELVERYAAAAARAQVAGFDGVEIHAAHGYLVAQFLSPTYNRREDRYGGPVENRARFLLETVAAVRRRVGGEYPVFVRLSAIEYEATDELRPVAQGLTLDDTRHVARLLEEAGVSSIDVSATLVGLARMHPMGWPEGQLVPLAEAIRREVSIPVSVTSRLPPALGERLLREGRLDLLTLGRALVADPELPRKLAEGRESEVVPCIYCNECLDPALRQPAALCAVNPALGCEGEPAPVPAPARRRVWVVGGGPAGLAAARAAALRGHSVELFEAGTALGGQMLLASKPAAAEQTLERLRDYLVHEVERLGVEVHLRTRWSAERLDEGAPDAVILASGARPAAPELPGIGDPRVVQAVDLLAGAAPQGAASAVVIGGGLVGCETALWLARRGSQVALVERGAQLAARVSADLRTHLLWAVAEAGVGVYTGTEATAIDAAGVSCRDAAGEPLHLPAERIVLAAGAEADDGLWGEVEGRLPKTFRIGDCRRPRNIRHALTEGYRAGTAV